MRVVFIGCVDFSYTMLAKVVSLPSVNLVGVVTRSVSALNADFCSLSPIAQKLGVPLLIDDRNTQDKMTSWIESKTPDVIYCFGWSYLLKKEILQIPKLGVIGYHPTALPKNRGRHPIIWTLALGLKETASSFFIMDEGADSGDLISQERLVVNTTDDASSLYLKLKVCALKQVEEFTPLLARGETCRVPQDHTQANYWRKRSKLDGKIDWRMPATGIYNLVRSLAKPYPGSHCEYSGREVKIWRCENLLKHKWDDKQIAHLEPGRVISSSSEGIDVRCGDGVIRLNQHEFSELPPPGVCL
jgi:methionyl-tRNA formyltransferase